MLPSLERTRMNGNSTFEIMRTLGAGGMATVSLARLHDGSRMVAVKQLHPHLADQPEGRRSLADEARILARIEHPNVVGVIDLVDGASPALVMDWVEGVDLARLMKLAAASRRRIPVDVAAAIARDVLDGLHAAHESRSEDGVALEVVHRDVSPQNILVGFDGVVRVADFGIATARSAQRHTVEGSISGKLGYLAPEQLCGRCDRRADVYSVGVVLWELLTGSRLRARVGAEVLIEILYARAERPSLRGAEASTLDAVVMRALEPYPEDRFATAAEMLASIDGHLVVASPARVAEVVRKILAASAAQNIGRKNDETFAGMGSLCDRVRPHGVRFAEGRGADRRSPWGVCPGNVGEHLRNHAGGVRYRHPLPVAGERLLRRELRGAWVLPLRSGRAFAQPHKGWKAILLPASRNSGLARRDRSDARPGFHTHDVGVARAAPRRER
jgi:eukaryotic-like serine/threonine-protein kinase